MHESEIMVDLLEFLKTMVTIVAAFKDRICPVKHVAVEMMADFQTTNQILITFSFSGKTSCQLPGIRFEW